MEGKYKAYPEYKETGVEWLGAVPAHWDVMLIKHLSTVRRGASPRPIDDSKYFDEQGEYAWTRIADVSSSDVYLNKTKQRLSDLGSSLSVKLEPGSLFLSIAGTVGKPCITKMKACIHDGFVYFPELYIPIKYLFYVFAGEQAYKGLGKFGTQLNLNTDTVGGIKIGCTRNDELEGIVRFLDHETAKIDKLIEKQKRLIELLKEKRQAVISHAVTKGLNPSAPLRPSGIDWLGDVPAHWVTTKAKYLFKFITSGSRGWAEYYSDTGSLFFRIANLTRETIEPKLMSIQRVSPPTDSEGSRAIIEKDDLLISITADLGSVCVATDEIVGGFVSQHVALCRPGEAVSSAFWLGYFILSDLAKEQLLSSGYGGTKIQLSLEDIKELWVVLPESDEQKEIAAYIDVKLQKFAQLMELADAQIKLLRERRTALISAAVTGKIDVRDWQAPSEELSEGEAA
ncbi:MAG: restriction endonuclease subunit S [Halopseudomonas aestusnigri]